MKKNLRRMFSYYKPYRGIFWADMFFALVAAAVSLAIPLIVRYITSQVVYFGAQEALHTIMRLGIVMLVLIVVQFYRFIGKELFLRKLFYCQLWTCHGSED